MVLIIGLVGLVLAARHHASRAPAETCSFERTWYQGDVHFSQDLEFDASGDGQWSTSGMASDAPHQRLWFRWSRTNTELTTTFGIHRHSVGYKMTSHGGHCFVRFDKPYLPVEGQALHYSDSR